MVCVLSLTNASEKKMIRNLQRIEEQLKTMIDAMNKSNELMEKLTNQLEIISLPPDMIKWARNLND